MIYRLVLSFIVGDTLLACLLLSYIFGMWAWRGEGGSGGGLRRRKAKGKFKILLRQFYLRWEPEQATGKRKGDQPSRGSGRLQGIGRSGHGAGAWE